VKLERKHAVLFLLIAAWNVLTYANFAKNLRQAAESGEDRPAGYYVAHIVLIVVNLVIAAVLGRLGWRAWRAAPSRESTPAAR
jgi:cytochrome c biogenesis protein ResB